jgi:hypothetical protein
MAQLPRSYSCYGRAAVIGPMAAPRRADRLAAGAAARPLARRCSPLAARGQPHGGRPPGPGPLPPPPRSGSAAASAAPSAAPQPPSRPRLTPEQAAFVDSDARHRLLVAVAGSGKTEALVHAALAARAAGANVIVCTKVSSVTEEVVTRVTQLLPQARKPFGMMEGAESRGGGGREAKLGRAARRTADGAAAASSAAQQPRAARPPRTPRPPPAPPCRRPGCAATTGTPRLRAAAAAARRPGRWRSRTLTPWSTAT